MPLKIRRALLTVSDKSGVMELARALHKSGTELVATGRTAGVLKEAGLPVIPIERISGSPEAFQGRMKTLSFPVCSGILYRRGDASDETDLKKLGLSAIDCVVVNFYPFEKAAQKEGIRRSELIEEIDIGGPTLVRAAAKNSPHVLVLTSPDQYSEVVTQLGKNGAVEEETAERFASQAWDRILSYDQAIAREFGSVQRKSLRYGENPHQKGYLEVDADGPIAWEESLTPSELSYNNILDLSAAYTLASDLKALRSDATGVVIVKHNNPCGVALVPKAFPQAQKQALLRAWEGDPVSAFGGVLMFTDPLEQEVAQWLSERFVELVAAPDLSPDHPSLKTLLPKRKNLKAVRIRRFGELPEESVVKVPGARLYQTQDLGVREPLKSVTKRAFPEEKMELARFGILVTRTLKSNAIALVRDVPGVAGAYQLVGAGQGQPNRIDALKGLAVPRAQATLRETGGVIGDCIMISDAFFPFRDTVDAAHGASIRFIVQPGGSIKDAESIAACDEFNMAMVFTGIRHFRH